jgi:hypothetical protein
MRRLVSIACALAAGCAGPASPATAPSTAARAPAAAPSGELGLLPGETMAFEVKLAGIPAGEAQLAVGQVGDVDGHRAVVVKSHAETTGAAAMVRHAVDESTTVIDAATGLPISLETVVEQGDSKASASATFHTAGSAHSADVTFRRPEDPNAKTQHLDFGTAAVHDAHSAMAQLRGWRATPGDKRSVYVVGGRRVWRVDVTYAGDDTIGLTVGNRRAMKFLGEAFRTKRDLSAETDKPNRTFAVWLSADADRVPLKLVAKTELGEITMELTEYSR